MSLVKTPALALLGLIALGLVAAKLWTGDLSVSQAGLRIGVLTAALVVAERVLLPIAKSLVDSGQRDR